MAMRQVQNILRDISVRVGLLSESANRLDKCIDQLDQQKLTAELSTELQSVDALRQYLEDIETALAYIVDHVEPESRMDTSSLVGALKLASMRSTISGSGQPNTKDSGSGNVNLF